MAVEFNRQFFIDVLNSEKAGVLCEVKGEAALEIASANAPVDSGDYRDGLQLRRVKIGDRVGVVIVGTDWKTLLIESITGNLARAIRAVKG